MTTAEPLVTTLLLPEDWSRLAGTELEPLVPIMNPADTRIVVVERDGAIVGCWAVTRWVHVEGLWIAPAYRKKAPGIGRRLVAAMTRVAREWGASFVWTGAATPEIEQLITKMGGIRTPVPWFVVPIGKGEVCQS